MTAEDIRADMQAGTPKRIWVWRYAKRMMPSAPPLKLARGAWDDRVSERSKSDVEYIRADLHAAQIAALEARVRELERQVDDAWSEYYKETSIPGTTNYKGYKP
jgi:hypothetical protein